MHFYCKSYVTTGFGTTFGDSVMELGQRNRLVPCKDGDSKLYLDTNGIDYLNFHNYYGMFSLRGAIRECQTVLILMYRAINMTSG